MTIDIDELNEFVSLITFAKGLDYYKRNKVKQCDINVINTSQYVTTSGIIRFLC